MYQIDPLQTSIATDPMSPIDVKRTLRTAAAWASQLRGTVF